tara:strand:+ start:51815 stop:52321 length:507 start_codon:yes stop_codon:yes gene_type:complete
MNKLFSIILCLLFFSCDDGDLQIETLDFDDVDVQTCDAINITEASILYKINDDEALILSLAANVLIQEVGTIEFDITATSATKLIYRIFSDTATTSYFCAAVPPITPTVIDEIIASKGTIIITTTATGTVDTPTYSHKIEFLEITLETAQDQRITDLTINDFGTITTN